MRVLWFTNIPLPVVSRRLGNSALQIGGWMEELRRALLGSAGFELGIASVSPKDFSPFVDGGVQYYNILSPPLPRRLPGRVELALHRWKHPIDFPDFLRQCLAIVEKFQPDVIHVHGTEGGFGLI